MFPRIITWEDGEKYEIDRVSGHPPGSRSQSRAVWIGGHRSYLFLQEKCGACGEQYWKMVCGEEMR